MKTTGKDIRRRVPETSSQSIRAARHHQYDLLARTYLRRQNKELIRQIRNYRKNEDIESIHQTRVSSRRVRAALEILQDLLPPRKKRLWDEAIRQLTGKLSRLRDCDVQIESVRDFRTQHKQEKRIVPGLARLMLRLEQRRTAHRLKVNKTLKQPHTRAVLNEILAATRTRSLGRTAPAKAASPGISAAHGRYCLDRCLAELLRYEESLNDSQDPIRHHKMRIAAKHLRYTMEVCEFVFGLPLEEPIQAIKELQTQLGELHDCDVWISLLENFREEEKCRSIEYYGHTRSWPRLQAGIELFLDDRRRRRASTFAKVVKFWRETRDKGLWQDIAWKEAPRHEPAGASKGQVP
jgi:CHAD domain-containing protein